MIYDFARVKDYTPLSDTTLKWMGQKSQCLVSKHWSVWSDLVTCYITGSIILIDYTTGRTCHFSNLDYCIIVSLIGCCWSQANIWFFVFVSPDDKTKQKKKKKRSKSCRILLVNLRFGPEGNRKFFQDFAGIIELSHISNVDKYKLGSRQLLHF